MGYTEVGGAKRYLKYAECDPGDVLIEGEFLRDFQGKFGIQYEFEEVGTGEIVVLNSSGQLNYKMEFIKPGQKVKIIYEGMERLTKGAMKGKDAHQFTVLRDDESADVVSDEESELGDLVEEGELPF